MQSLAERIRFLREASGRDAAPLSQLCGLASSHLGMIERGRVTNLTEKTLRAIAEATGATLPWLAFGQGEAPTEDVVRRSVDARESAPRDVPCELVPGADSALPATGTAG